MGWRIQSLTTDNGREFYWKDLHITLMKNTPYEFTTREVAEEMMKIQYPKQVRAQELGYSEITVRVAEFRNGQLVSP